MTAWAGVNGGPLKYKLHQHTPEAVLYGQRVSIVPYVGGSLLKRYNWPGLTLRCTSPRIPRIKCAMDASYGDATNGFSDIFPRIKVKDPYKQLGINKEASEDEIQSARNFLVQRYAGHKPSVDAIESAHDKIIMQKFNERRKPKLNVKKKVLEVTQSKFVQAVTSRFRTPSTNVMIRTAISFVVLGGLTVLFPTEEGPTLQVAISLILTVYFIYDRLKSTLWALLYGLAKNEYFILGACLQHDRDLYSFLASGDILDGVCNSTDT